MIRVGLIGFGAIGQDLTAALQADAAQGLLRLTILVRAGRAEATAATLAAEGWQATVTEDPAALGAQDVVVEAAGHGAVDAHGAAILRAGVDLIAASVGALEDDARRAALTAASAAGGGRLIVPAGAMGAIDALAAARLSGLTAVTYKGRKPPAAWAGSPVESVLDLPGLRTPMTFFDGSAREAARDYPKNANVAATLALAGLGFEDTRVQLIADPTTQANTHEVTVESGAGRFSITLEGRPSARNPRTSALTALSLARLVRHRTGGLVI